MQRAFAHIDALGGTPVPWRGMAKTKIPGIRRVQTVNKWRMTEQRVCEWLGAEHIGGPGQPDCRRGALVVEVKDWESRRVNRRDLQAIIDKPWVKENDTLIVYSSSGFTDGARELADEYDGVYLFEPG